MEQSQKIGICLQLFPITIIGHYVTALFVVFIIYQPYVLNGIS